MDKLHARVREIRARAAIQRYEIRQMKYAGGVWFRLQRLLTFSRQAWTISDADARGLMAAGHEPHPAGLELEPPRRFFILREDGEVTSLRSAREVPLHASTELLVAPAVALVLFKGIDPAMLHRKP